MSLNDYSEFDSNYFIPYVAETPLTLEEILQQDDQQLDNVIDQQDLSLLNNCDDSDLSFLTDFSSNSASSLNINHISYIKSQISLSKDEKVNSGNPCCLTASKSYIIIGTFYSHILVFDLSTEKLKWFWKQDPEFGSISALSINSNENKLICGGSKGTISLWNIINGELLRLLENLHAPFSSIINLKYLSDSNFIILSDTSGSVFTLDGRKKDLDSNCIFTGSRGEVLAIQPLIVDDVDDVSHFSGIENLCLVAMATVSKVIVLSLRPNLFVHFSHFLKANLEFLPILCWNFSFKYKNKNISLLTFGREDQLYIHKMETDFEDKINFIPLYQFKSSSYFLQNIFCIHSDTFLIVDTNENLHLIDFLAQEETETLDISHIELVYESSNFKSLVNDGNVSKAMAKAGEHACANSFALQRVNSTKRLLILGLNSVYEVGLRTWLERVDFLLENNESSSALQLIYRKYLSLRDKVDYDEASNRLLTKVLNKMEDAFSCFSNFIFDCGYFNSRNEVSLRKIASVLFKYCVCLESKYEKIFDLFEKLQQNEMAKKAFLECLERYIFNGQLANLHPNLVKEIVSYYIEKRWYNLLDSMIINLSIISLDIDFIVKISLDYYLYDSFIYIHNVAFRDFITPFDKLLQVLQRLIEDKIHYNKEDILLGNKLLVYLNCMLTCTYYPNKGRIESSDQFEHLEKVYTRILSSDSSNQPNVLYVLFKYDATEFLNVLLIAFDYLDQNHTDLLKWKQTLIDFFLLQLIENENKQFGIEHKSVFFIFVARCLISCSTISINKKYFIMMIESLFSSENKRFEERQQILLQILEEKKFEHFCEPSLFLENAQKTKMYKICEFIHEKNQNWNQLLLVYINDATKEGQVFEFIHSLLSQESVLKSPTQKANFLSVVFENFLNLIKIDCQKAVGIFCTYSDQSENAFCQIIKKLACEPRELYHFLKLTIFENRINYSKSSSSDESKSQRKIFDLCFNAHYQEQYIELTCQFEPTSLIFTLDVLQECDLNRVLKICQRFRCREGEAYIHEKSKRFTEAFEILFEDFKYEMHELIQSCFNNLTNYNDCLQFANIEVKFSTLLDFCKRSFKYSIEEQMREKFCLLTLEFMIDIKSNLNNICKMKNDKLPPQFFHLLTEPEKKPFAEQLILDLNVGFKLLFEKLINLMLTHLSLVDFFGIIVNKLLENDDLYDVREMLLCILENYHYEKTLLELTNNILSCEHYGLVSQFQQSNVRPNNARQSHCGLCGRVIIGSTIDHCKSSNAVLYNCSHIFHEGCIKQLKNAKTAKQHCPRCNAISSDELNAHGMASTVEKDQTDITDLDQSIENTSKNISNTFSLIESQLRALNYFHQGRLKKH